MNIGQLFLPSNYYLNWHAVPFFITGILITAEALFVYIQNRKSPLNFGFAIVTVCAGIWLSGVGFMYSVVNGTIALLWSRYYCWLGVIFICPSVYLFSVAVEQKTLTGRIKFICANYLIALGFYLICISTPFFVREMFDYPWGFYPKGEIIEKLFLIWYAILLFLAFLNFIRSYKNETTPIKKKQAKFIIIAFIFGAIGGSIDFLATVGVPLYPFGSLSVFLFLSIMAYSIVRYKLMDIETVLHKTILWVLSFSVITVPILLLYRLVFSMMKDSVFLQIVFWTMSLVAFTFYLRLIQPKIDHVFQRRRADMDAILNRFIEDLVHLKGLNNLILYIERTIANTMYPQWTDIFIYNEKQKKYAVANRTGDVGRSAEFDGRDGFLKWLKEYNRIVYREFIELDPIYASIEQVANDYFRSAGATVAIPLILNEQLLGIINLAKKANLRRYSGLDFQFLTTLKNQSAIAISNSLIYQNIEEQVTLRSEELVAVQKQLIQAEKLATVGTLSGGVAHEINNPLTAILTNVQMLLAFSDKKEVQVDRDSLELIEEATQRCRMIVQKLMTYAKKPMKTSEVSKINVLDALKKTVAFLEYQLEQEDVKIILEAEEGDYPVMGNRNELEQVMTNIILNARDAIMQHKKKGDIHLTLSRTDNRIKMDIKDDGKGIAQDIIPKIFDPFFTTKDVGKGLGLGLSICQSIIEKHKGRITVKSEVGQGTTFTITLPRHSLVAESSHAGD
ncbi:MAG: GHKL domain-containing protein [Candidatus Omnitrophica bacterium]|nr:GHKL domain-containing protein [Candidatus Omnitrophota bacterium]